MPGRKAWIVFAIITGLGASSPFPARALNLVVNGSFETLSQSVPNSAYTVSFGSLPTSIATGWTLGVSGGQSYDGIATASGGAISDFNSMSIADGTNAIFLQGTGTATQTVNLNAGSYALTYSLMGRAGSAGSAPNPITVTLSSGLLNDTETPVNTDVNNLNDWAQYTDYFSVTTAGSYTLQFKGDDPYSGSSDHTTFIDNISLAPFVAVAPTIISQPSPQQTLFAGQTVQFTVQAGGTPPPSYQWQVETNGTYVNLANGGRISGATNATLVISNLSVGDSTNYLARAANFAGATNSAVAALTVLPAPPPGSPRASVTVINPSFEDSQQSGDIYTTSYGTLNPQTGIPGWQFSSSGGDSYAGLVTESGTLMGTPKYIPQCWQAAFIQGTGQFLQSVTFQSAGTYVIRFRAEGRSNGGAGAETIAVSVDGNGVGNFTPLTTGWTLFMSSPFTVTAGAHAITFAGTVPFSTSDRTSFIDDVQIVTPAEAVAVTPPTSPVYDIIFVGDSITYGATLANPATQASAVQCMQSLGTRFNVGARMSNQGHSGATTVDWLPGSSYIQGAVAAAAALETNQPGQLIFSIMLGVNDSAQSGPNGSPVSPTNYLQNLQSIVGQFLADYPGAYVFVHYPTWYSTNTQNGAVYLSAGLARLQTYFPEIDQLISLDAISHPGRVFAGDKGLAFNTFSNNFLADMTPESGPLGTFYLHPNATGAVVLGKIWADTIATSLNFATNDSYIAWLQSWDMTPGTPGTGFSDTPTNSTISNGISYGNPNGLMAALGTGPISLNVSADVRNDSSVTAILQSSSDLINWNPLAWYVAAGQNGVATGFIRYTVQDPVNLSQIGKFYRLQLSQ